MGNKGRVGLRSTDLPQESIAGIAPMQEADTAALEAAFGQLTSEMQDGKKRALAFSYSTYAANVQTNEDNRITVVFLGLTDYCNLAASRGIGAKSTLADVLNACGESYHKESLSNFMGSGDGYIISYVDREHDRILQFAFNEGNAFPGTSDGKTRLVSITLQRHSDVSRSWFS